MIANTKMLSPWDELARFKKEYDMCSLIGLKYLVLRGLCGVWSKLQSTILFNVEIFLIVDGGGGDVGLAWGRCQNVNKLH